MAGIGFELRKLLERDSYTGLLQAYGYAGIISAGPWVLSIMGILVLGFINQATHRDHLFISEFQTSVTYLIAISLILSGFLQLSFTRYIADQLFLKQPEKVVSTFHGALFLTTVTSGLLGSVFFQYLMWDQSVYYRFLMIAGLVVLSNIWITTTLLSGLKSYKAILLVFFIGYAFIVIEGFLFKNQGLLGLLFAFVSGHVLLLTGMLMTLYREYPIAKIIDFDFLKIKKMFISLVLTGFFYNLGVWMDKFIFWFHPDTGLNVIGPLRASIIYDLPIFLAYLATIPGMAVFLVRMETDFVEYYDRFYNSIRDGGSLSEIKLFRNEMVMVAKQGIYEIIKIQALAVLAVFVMGSTLLSMLGISPLYYHLLCVDVVSTGLQVVLLGIMNVFFYLDKRSRVLQLSFLFALGNGVLSYCSIVMGAYYFGYGVALTLLLVNALGLYYLSRDFESLEYETFMLQPV